MELQSKKRYAADDYLAFEAESPEKHEFYNGEIFLMAGGSEAHGVICGNIFAELNARFRKKKCRAFNSEIKIYVRRFNLYTYADATVACDKPNFIDSASGIYDNPSLIVEVLSKSTEGYDRGDKFRFYRSIESFKEYVLVHQHTARIEYYHKRSEHQWSMTEFEGLDTKLRLKHSGISIPFSRIYENVVLEVVD
jgi:Uma2 family endonuclease